MDDSSLIVIGAGPGGYAAALEAAERGFSVTLVERAETGGACLNRGCIPSKFFLSRAKEGAIQPQDMAALRERKEALLATLRQRMDQAAKSSKIQRVQGTARFVATHAIEVKTAAGTTQRLEANAFVLATGTQPVKPAFFPAHPAIHDSTSILALARRPERLVVVGGGYIGSELACAFRGLGSHVTLIEKEAALLATQPEFSAAAGILQRSFHKSGITVWTGTEIKSVQSVNETTVALTCSNGSTLEADAVLLAMGRKADFDSLNLQAAGLALTNQRLVVNAHGQTMAPHIYAIGDLVSPLPLAHTAAKEAEVAIAHLADEPSGPIQYSVIPRCIYTTPEISAVGLSEAQAQAAGTITRLDRYHFGASAKAMIEEDTEGFWTVTSDERTGKILGALIVGPHATELIHLVALSLRAGFTTTDISETVFAHPSLSESFAESMKRSIRKSAKATHL